jgi:hypothetical protein
MSLFNDLFGPFIRTAKGRVLGIIVILFLAAIVVAYILGGRCG